MQQTTRLVAPLGRYAQILLLSFGLLLVSGSLANAQSAPSAKDAPSSTWGEKDVPENYVPSKGPAEEGHTYNWVQMAYAGLVMVGMVGFMVWLVRRTPRKSNTDSLDTTE